MLTEKVSLAGVFPNANPMCGGSGGCVGGDSSGGGGGSCIGGNNVSFIISLILFNKQSF